MMILAFLFTMFAYAGPVEKAAERCGEVIEEDLPTEIITSDDGMFAFLLSEDTRKYRLKGEVDQVLLGRDLRDGSVLFVILFFDMKEEKDLTQYQRTLSMLHRKYGSPDKVDWEFYYHWLLEFGSVSYGITQDGSLTAMQITCG